MDTNKGCERKFGLKRKMIDCKDSKIQSFSKLDTTNNLWTSQIIIPWNFLHSQFKMSGDIHPARNELMRKWMINMFCARMKKNVKMCNTNSDCEFIAWSPTGNYDKPNFHMCAPFKEIELLI